MAMAVAASNQQTRCYAKKGGKALKGGKKGANSDDDDDDDSNSRKGKGKSSGSTSVGVMSFDPLDLEKKFSQCLERLKKDFTTMRAGTANPGMNQTQCASLCAQETVRLGARGPMTNF